MRVEMWLVRMVLYCAVYPLLRVLALVLVLVPLRYLSSTRRAVASSHADSSVVWESGTAYFDG